MTPQKTDAAANRRILLVDDNPETLDTIRAMLAQRGFTVMTASSGKTALAHIATTRFDLVITDCRMAPVDGWAVLSEVKRKGPETPVIMLTGYGDMETAVAALRQNADDFLLKPVSSESLFSRINICLARQAMEKRSRLAESKLVITNRAIEALQVGLVICEAKPPDYPVIYVNRQFEELTGYASGEIIGRSTRILQGPGTDPETVAAIGNALRQGRPYSGDILNHRSDGAPFWNHLIISPVFDDSGVREHFVATLMDISARKHAEEELRNNEARLRESENRFRQLSENIDDVFWLTNHDLTETLYISPSYEQLWRLPCEELYRRPESRLSRIHHGDRFTAIYNFNPAPEQAYEIAYRLEFPDAPRKWVRERGFPIQDEAGRNCRFAVVFSDITEEKRLREEMDGYLRQVVHTDRLAGIGEVVAGVAHEINNPNSFITYNIPLLAETWQAFKPIVAEYARLNPGTAIGHLTIDEMMTDMTDIIAAIETGSERINRIVANLKDFARLDESTHFQPVCLNTAVQRAMTIVGAQLRKSADVVDVSLTDPMPLVQGHPQKLEQIVVNLLVNAANAILHKKGGRISIRTRTLEWIGAVLLEVTDNGTGIAREYMERLFEPFFTTRRTEGGTGLGLSVSYGLVKEQRGAIGVLSRPGRGSCFQVYLPLSSQAPLELNPTILCVDDQPAVLRLIRSMLIKAEDRFVKTVASPTQVIPFLETHPEVDIVLSDILMPGLDGWQLLKMIRTRFPLIGVILFSGQADVLEHNPEPALVPDAVLSKPFERADLVQAIHAVGRMKL